MKVSRVYSLLLGVALVLPLAGWATAHADDDHGGLGPYKLITTIPIPGDLSGGFDISWVDPEAGRYYLADRGTKSVDVIDARHNKFLEAIPLMAAGNGVVAIRQSSDEEDESEESEGAAELWVGDAQSFVEVIDLKTQLVVAHISTGGTARADELANDPRDHIVVVANDRDTPPFLTFISTRTRMALGQLKYPQATGHGLEQTVWDSKTGKFYLAVPATSTNPNGEVDEIDPHTMSVTRIFVTRCNPAGLVLVPRQKLMTSCGDVIDVKTGSVVTTVAGVGGDEIWFNRGDERVYFGGGRNRISVPVVDTDTNTLVTTITVGVLNTPPTPSHTTHSVAADSENNRIFVPVTREGVKVYTASREDD